MRTWRDQLREWLVTVVVVVGLLGLLVFLALIGWKVPPPW